jgi:hypothetical protein
MSTATPSPESHADALRGTMQRGGAPSMIEYILALPEGERLGVFSFAQQYFSPRGEATIDLDDYTAIARAGIAEALRRSAAAGDADQSARLKDTANIFSFNLLADLAECWPDDAIPRERRHFEEGLRAADDCIRWREELGKPGERKALGWWGRGMHLLSLARYDEARDAFETACRHVFGGEDFTVSAASTFDQLINRGYRALGRIAAGDAEGEEEFTTVCGAFEDQLAVEAKREDAQFGLDQLAIVEAKLRSRMDA